MKPIWYFVGLLLLSIGTVITVSGVVELLDPPPRSTILAHLHPSIWWGALMILSGVVFLLVNRRKRVG